MKGILLSTETQDWQSADYRFGVVSADNGASIAQEKILSDRRNEGGGVGYLLKFTPPHGKLIRLVATARSDEHVFILEGGYCDKRGRPQRFPGDYGLNPSGHTHSAFIGKKTVALVIYAGEPDEVHECAVVQLEAAQRDMASIE
jgi:hypothetical protein